MVNKILLIGFVSLWIIGCKSVDPKVEYRDKAYPVYVVPHPPKVDKPKLEIENLTDSQKNDIGQLSKAYAISLKQTMQYACKLKNIVDEYEKLSEASPLPVEPIKQSLSTLGDTLDVNINKDCTNP